MSLNFNKVISLESLDNVFIGTEVQLLNLYINSLSDVLAISK